MNITSLLPVLISGTGLFFIIRLRAFFIFHPIRTARILFGALADRTARRSLCLALAGTLGVGNVLGVAVGLMLGGPGMLFWLLVSALFASVIKYSEAALSTISGTRGMIGVISLTSRPRATLYAALVLALSLTMGSSLQCISLADSASVAFGISPALTAVALAAATIAVVIGGREKIESATELVIPVATATYIAITVAVIAVNLHRIPTVISAVISSALTPRAAGGGIFAFLGSSALREGFARGILSNEAGAGTSSLAHSASGASPVAAGLFGILEVTFDTVILCPLTALAILTAIPDPTAYHSAMSLVCAAVATSLGQIFLFPLFLSISAFAYSTVVCWYYYGRISLEYLFNKRFVTLYTAVFALFILLGGSIGELLVISMTDLIILPMTVITLCALLKNASIVRHTTETAISPRNKHS